jgi:phage tail-like protein
MAQNKQQIKTTYPLPVYNYRVTVVDEATAAAVGFSEVSGLALEYEPVTYKHGFSFISGSIIIPGMRQPIRLTLKKGIVKAGDFLYRWIERSYNEPFYQNIRRDIVIDLCDEAGGAVVRWKVRGALPVKLEAPGFDAGSNDVAIESMELIAHGLDVNYQPLS